MWKERQLRNQPRQQGTELFAMQQLANNRTLFHYPTPPHDFEHKIEYSLLYAMLSSAGPSKSKTKTNVYPTEVVLAAIDDEDFTTYMCMCMPSPTSTTSISSALASTGTTMGDTQEDDSDDPTHNHTSNPNHLKNNISYKQLSAILSYSAEQSPHDATANPKDDQNKDNMTPSISIAQKLCKKILHTVVTYAQEHDLDRQHEIEELLRPVQRVAQQRIDKKELAALLPFYLGYSAALLTGNPIPLFLAIGMVTNVSGNRNEIQNMDTVLNEADRKADVERTSLLDEIEE
jgi:hypothetical protein